MKKGVVKFFNPEKHFGFIAVEGTGEQIFVHQSALKNPIRENDKVVFDIGENAKGMHALNVRLSEE